MMGLSKKSYFRLLDAPFVCSRTLINQHSGLVQLEIILLFGQPHFFINDMKMFCEQHNGIKLLSCCCRIGALDIILN